MDNRSEEFVGLLTGAPPALYGFVLSLVHDRSAARDVLQEVNLTLWRKADGFAPGTNFFAWACRVSQFHVMNHRRSMARDRLVFDDELCLQLAEHQVEHAQANDRRAEALKDCLEKLPAAERPAEVHVLEGKVEVGTQPGGPRRVLEAYAAVGVQAGQLVTVPFRGENFAVPVMLLADAQPTIPAPSAPKPDQPGVVNSVGVQPVAVKPGGEFTFHLNNDHLEIVTGDRDEVTIQLVGELPENRQLPEVRLRRDGTRVRAEVNPPGGGLRFRATVPKKFNLDVQSISASVTVTNIEGNVRAKTASGTINIADVRGDVEAEGAGSSLALRSATGRVWLKTAGGSLARGEAGGDAELETAGGSIKALITRGKLRAKTAGGSIKVGAAFGAVEAETAGGSVSASFFVQPAGESRLRADGGSVEARVADKLTFDVKCFNP